MLSNNISPEINNCVCCLSEVSIPARLSCGHLIDLNCIGNWMMKHERNTCPLDRKQISKVTSLNLDPSNTVSLVIPGEFPMKFYGV